MRRAFWTSRARRSAIALSVAAAAIGAAPPAGLDRAAAAAPPPAFAQAEAARVDRQDLMRVVRTLSAPSFEGRRTGTPGGLAARRFIRDAFEQIGLTELVPGFLQPFTFAPSNGRGPAPPVRSAVTESNAANVIGSVPGTRPGAPAFVVSAHYDHVGRRNGVIYPGADDNASGVAALLAIARYVRAHPLAHTVVFAAFDAEEPGLEGAKAFMKTPPVPATAIALNVNLDMVSRSDRNEIFAAGTYHTPSLAPIVTAVQRRSAVTIRFGHDRPMSRTNTVEDWTLQSDHGVFHAAGVPFLYFGVEDHPDYHQPTDTADKIDPAFFGNVAEMLVDVVVTADAALP